jgi:uncharacterized Zn-binding protein involved in type VI secretion
MCIYVYISISIYIYLHTHTTRCHLIMGYILKNASLGNLIVVGSQIIFIQGKMVAVSLGDIMYGTTIIYGVYC